EAREMVADDLFGRVALDAMRAGVPADDDAVGVQHVEGVVGHPRHQQAELALALAQRVLRGAALGDVAGNLGEALELAGRSADCAPPHRSREAAAVLAHAPAFGLVAPLAGGGLEDAARQARRALLPGIEPGEMLAHDLVRRVALEPPRPGVPAAHHPAR